MLHVVEHEEYLLVAQSLGHHRHRVGVRARGGIDRVGDGGHDRVRSQQRCQLDVGDTVREAVTPPVRCCEGQPGLAHAAGAGERDQAPLTDQLDDPVDLGVPADEGGRRERELSASDDRCGVAGCHGGARPGGDSGDQPGPVGLRGGEGVGQGPDAVGVGTGAGAALEGADGVAAQGRTLRKLLLREPRCFPETAQQCSEGLLALATDQWRHRSRQFRGRGGVLLGQSLGAGRSDRRGYQVRW